MVFLSKNNLYHDVWRFHKKKDFFFGSEFLDCDEDGNKLDILFTGLGLGKLSYLIWDGISNKNSILLKSGSS